MDTTRHCRQKGKRALRFDSSDQQRFVTTQPACNLLCLRMCYIPQLLQQFDLVFAAHIGGVDHILPSRNRTAKQAVTLLHKIPLVEFQLLAGHTVTGTDRKFLRFHQGVFIQIALFDKSHNINCCKVAEAVIVQKNLPARVAAIEILTALLACLPIYPSGFSRVTHLL